MSKLPFELLLALRYLRPRRTFVSIITVISIAGVALGVAVLIIVISVMTGFGHDLREKILGFNAPLQIQALDKPLDHYEDVMRIVSSNKNVIGVAPFVVGQVMVQTQPTNGESARFSAPYLRGVDINTESSVTTLPQSVQAGTFDLSGQSIVIGSEFAEQNNLNVGDRVSIYSPKELQKMAEQAQHGKTNEEATLPDDYTVTGIFDVGWFDYNLIVATSLENAQDLYDLNDSVHGLSVKLRDPYQADEVRQELEQTLGPGYKIITWEEQNRDFLGAVKVEKSMMYYIMFFIVIVASFGITCTLITFVVTKTREIGLMKAVGATNFQVMLVFVLQSVIVSVFGVASGLGIGLFALYFRNNFLHIINQLTGSDLFRASVYGFGELPAIIDPLDLTIICVGSFVICLLAAILPAWHASKMNTVEALRHE